MIIVILMAGIIFFNMQNVGIGPFLTLDDKMETTIGSGAVDRNKNVGL